MIEYFVAERGGGLLMRGMVDEEFINRPIAYLLPIQAGCSRFFASV